MRKYERSLHLLIYKNYSKITMKTDKTNNFLQIYYYRRAAVCYPGGLKNESQKTNFLTKLVDKIFGKRKEKSKIND